jgi:hypothetical protein
MTGCLEISGLSWPLETINRLHVGIDGLETAARGASVIAPLVRHAGSSTSTNDVSLSLLAGRGAE